MEQRNHYASARGQKVKESYRPFTIRLTQEKYDSLLARAQKNRRSLAGEVDVILDNVL